jgi:hypothetical protein
MRKNNDPTIGIGGAPTRCSTLPEAAAERKKFPIATGFLDYFPDAIAAVANVSYAGNEQHNPGQQPLHWARGKSNDEADTMLRHFSQRGTIDTDGKRHSAKAAWRMLAILQKEIEAEQALRTPKEIPAVLSEETIAAEASLERESIAAHQTLVEALRDAGCEVIGSTRDEHGHTHHVINPEHRMGAQKK